MNQDEYEDFKKSTQSRLEALGLNMDWVEIPPGWWVLLEGFIKTANRIDVSFTGASIVQVKQKFGWLTVYYSSLPNKEIDNLITLMDYESKHTCERCGSPGMFVSKELFKTARMLVVCEPCLHDALG